MRISKNGHPIDSVQDWFTLAPPKAPVLHWKDGRSAKELAKAWFPTSGPRHVPDELLQLLYSISDFGQIVFLEAWPEVAVRFDEFRGEPRNTDLLIRGNCSLGQMTISIEAKADETFGEMIGKAYDIAQKRPRSNAPERMRRLAAAMLGQDIERIRTLRYQLLHGTAAAISAASQSNSAIAVFVVHEFITELTQKHKILQNEIDLNTFVSVLSGNPTQIEPGRLMGPFRVPGNTYIPNDVDLFVGKSMRHTTVVG